MTDIVWIANTTANTTWTSGNTVWYNSGAYEYRFTPDYHFSLTYEEKYFCPQCNKEYDSKPKVCKKCGKNDKELI
jgi:hypothetical protein